MAKDRIHDPVKQALIKDGWKITDEHLTIEYAEFSIAADIAAERRPIVATKNRQKIIVEVKSFIGKSFIREFQQAIGQYEIYFDLIDLAQLDYELYLGISQKIHQDFFLQKAAQAILKRHNIKLVIVNLKREEVVKWIE